MWTQFLLLLAAALLSSLITLALAYGIFVRVLRPRLEEHVDRQVQTAIEDLGKEVEARVKRGVVDGVASLPSTEVLAGATRTAARSGVDLMGTLLGVGRRPREK
ncbi:MAG: hypothetical protein MI919_40310 [Holophagales bacterium]|nr:hypothetical protein [Holophagales bacterium]